MFSKSNQKKKRKNKTTKQKKITKFYIVNRFMYIKYFLKYFLYWKIRIFFALTCFHVYARRATDSIVHSKLSATAWQCQWIERCRRLFWWWKYYSFSFLHLPVSLSLSCSLSLCLRILSALSVFFIHWLLFRDTISRANTLCSRLLHVTLSFS